MSSNPSNGRRKAIIVSLLAFLFIGGGLFMFLIYQGLGDMKGDSKDNFSYGFNVRSAVLPVFQYFGLAENSAGQGEETKKRLEARGLEPSLLDEPQADISDWMAKGKGAERGSRSSASSSAPAVRTGSIPRLGGGLSGAGGTGASSQSGAAISKFGGGADSGDTKISKMGQGGSASMKGHGTLTALSSARASLGEGLRSGSAMTARAKWDQGFGVGTTGKRSGELAYGKSGLVKLDGIKSGDIANLKTMDPGSLKVTEPGKPSRDTEGEAKAKTDGSSTEKDIMKSMVDAAGQGINKGVSSAVRGSGSQTDGSGKPTPPAEVLALGGKPQTQGGSYCPDGCSCGQGCTFKDNKPVYVNNPDGSWSVGYTGQQTDANGKTISYVDVCKLDPGASNPSKLQVVGEGSDLKNLSYVPVQ